MKDMVNICRKLIGYCFERGVINVFCFIDESGYPKPSEKDPRPVLVSVCIKNTDIRQITQRLYKAELDCFGEDPLGTRKLKGKKLINERSLKPNYNNRKDYVEKFLDVLEMYDTAIFAIVMDKPDFVPYEEKDLLPIQHRFLIQRLDSFGKLKKTDVLVIFDKVDETKDGSEANGFKGFLFKHEEGKQLTNIVEMPLFVASINTPLIRFPDITGNILREYYNNKLDAVNPGNEYEQWLKELGNRIHLKSVNFKNKFHINYGIYQMSKDKFIRRPR